MTFNFDENETMFMYKHFKNQIRLLESQKDSSNRPVDFDQKLNLYISIINEFERVCPTLIKLCDQLEKQIDF